MKAKKVNIEERYNSPFPTLLRELLKKYSVSQAELAEKLDVTRQTISSYQLGDSVPDIYTFRKIVDFFNEKFNLNYSIDYWLGREEVFTNTKKEQINLSNKSIEKLKEYQKNKFLFLTIELILSQPAFLKRLSDYLVNSNINEIIEEDKFLSDFKSYNFYLNPNIFERKKYKYYDFLEILPRMNIYSKNKIMEELCLNNYLIFEYIETLVKDEVEEIENLTDEEIERYRKDIEILNKDMDEFINSKQNKKMLEEYELYKKQRKGELE